MSTILCLIFINFGWGTYILFKYYFKEKMLPYVLNQIYYLIITIIGGTVTYYICGKIVNDGIIGLFLKLIICIVVSNIIYVICFKWKKEYKEAILFLKRLIKH